MGLAHPTSGHLESVAIFLVMLTCAVPIPNYVIGSQAAMPDPANFLHPPTEVASTSTSIPSPDAADSTPAPKKDEAADSAAAAAVLAEQGPVCCELAGSSKTAAEAGTGKEVRAISDASVQNLLPTSTTIVQRNLDALRADSNRNAAPLDSPVIGTDLYSNIEGMLQSSQPTTNRKTYFELKERYQIPVALEEQYERQKRGGPEAKIKRVHELNQEMALHKDKYDKVFEPWSKEQWIGDLRDTHNKLKATFKDDPRQPNPWVKDDPLCISTSKNYLIKVMKEFKDISDPSTSPICIIKTVCMQLIEDLGGAEVFEIEFGANNLKKRRRCFEKVLNLDGHYDCIRDYARYCIVIKKGHNAVMPEIPALLAKRTDVRVVRAKNRFDPDYDSYLSGGYRDYQIILATNAGWLIEVQVIAEEMYALKKDCGHKNYTQFRFLREANERGLAEEEIGEELHRRMYDLTADLYDLAADASPSRRRQSFRMMQKFKDTENPSEKFEKATAASSTKKIARATIELSKELGEGAFGVVMMGKMTGEDGGVTDCACKTLKSGSVSGGDMDALVAETLLMSGFDHPNVVKCFGMSDDGDPAMIVLEFCPNGSLFSYVGRKPPLATKNLLEITDGLR